MSKKKSLSNAGQTRLEYSIRLGIAIRNLGDLADDCDYAATRWKKCAGRHKWIGRTMKWIRRINTMAIGALLGWLFA